MTPVAAVEEPIECEFDQSLWDEVVRHKGKWVVTSDDEILGVGDTPEAAIEDAGDPKSPTLIHVPEGDNLSYLL